MERQRFDLLVDRSGTGYRARVVRSPGGEGESAFELPGTRVDLERLLTGPARPPGSPPRDVATGRASRLRPTAMADFGRRLFEAVFAGPVSLCYGRSLATLAAGQGLTVRLRLTDVPE